jgi:hypothetical protein
LFSAGACRCRNYCTSAVGSGRAESGRQIGESELNLSPKRADGADDDGSDERDEKTIFNASGGRIIDDKRPDNIDHDNIS